MNPAAVLRNQYRRILFFKTNDGGCIKVALFPNAPVSKGGIGVCFFIHDVGAFLLKKANHLHRKILALHMNYTMS